MDIPGSARRNRFGLFANIESKRVALPLKGVEATFTVLGGVADVCLTQIFRHENQAPFDCEYLFPLPADASVYFCEADINEKVIQAVIKEREEARNIVREKKAAGFRTALVESERNNLFTLGLGNVQPGDLIIIRLKYFQAIRALDQTRSLEIPFCPGVRYIPGNPLLRSNRGKGVVDDTDEVPDASRISPVRIDAEHPDAAYVDVRGRLDAKYADAQALVSPSHSIEIQPSNGELTVALSGKGEVPDRDFVLCWQENHSESMASRAWTCQKNGETYALLEIRAPQQAEVRQTAIDFYFLLDRSGSMAGQKWTKAVEALQSCVRILGPNDRAMITVFENSFRDFAEGPLPVAQVTADPQFDRLEQIGAKGGTNLAPALKHVLEIAGEKSKGRTKNLILITDAQIGNEPAILNLMRTAPDMAVHCFGIDIALNDALLLALTRQQGGTFQSLNPNENIQAEVAKLGKTLREPVLVDLNLLEGWEIADARIPNLYAGQILYLSAKTSGQAVIKLSARSASGEPMSLDFQVEPVSQASPCLMWCKTRIQRYVAEGRYNDAIALSVASNLLCRLTAFVAWDESEKVVISRHELVQPALHLSESIVRGQTEADVARMICRRESEGVRGRGQSPRSHLLGRMERENVPLENLRNACQRLGGDDWQEPFNLLARQLSQSTGDQLAQRNLAINTLALKLNTCASLKRILEMGASPINSLNVPGLKAAIRQQRIVTVYELKDMENIFQEIDAVNESTTREQLELLARHIRHQAVEMLKRFIENVSA